jgi:DMSO/TMAO reductase YedYZ molybdopterin-dependent catalytic subunit
MPETEPPNMFGVAASRRKLLMGTGAFVTLAASRLARAESIVRLPLPDRPDARPITTAFPQKGAMILQRSRAPLLETPLEVFDQGTFTPNDRFYVRWHWPMPSEVDAEQFRLTVSGHVERPLALSLADLTALPAVEVAAVNQCSGNSRGLFEPPIPGGQWGNGAMGNALWRGVRLSDVLDRAGVKAGAVAVRFGGLDTPVVPDGPQFRKSLTVEHARNGEVMIAYAMNGLPLPLLNGFPLRLVVPGWFATYWVKMLDTIEVLDQPDDNFWMAKAYLIPDTPHADIKPGAKGVKMVPINRMLPRSFITNLAPGARLAVGAPQLVRGIAFGGDAGVARVDFSSDGGKTWVAAQLGEDTGKYGFRRWEARFTAAAPGDVRLAVRCTNTQGDAQPDTANWNPGGYMRNVVETVVLTAA